MWTRATGRELVAIDRARFGKVSCGSGIIGITLIPETLKTWAYSLHACNTVVSNLDQMRTQEQHVPASQTHHKEEAKARVKTDTKNRKALRDKLEVCIDPLHPEDNQQGIVNIVAEC